MNRDLKADLLRVAIEVVVGLMLCVLLFRCSAFAAGPRIENFKVRTEANGCKFASFTLTGGDAGNYYLTCNSPEFPRFYLPPDLWIAVTRIEYSGTAYYANVPLYTNFTCCQFRLEKIQ